MKLKLLALSCAIAVVLLYPRTAFADMLETLTFSELPETPIPPTLHDFGIMFSYTEDATIGTGAVADFGAPFSGMASDLTSPVLLGNAAGVLTLVFDNPTTVLSFDAASAVTTSNEFQVRLFNASNVSLGTTNMALTPTACSPPSVSCANLAQAVYSYSGSAVAKAELDFSSFVPGATPAPFAIDNLSYLVPSVTPPPTVPEPGTVWLLFSAIGLFATTKSYQFMRRKRLSE